jgi:hypothetical protein
VLENEEHDQQVEHQHHAEGGRSDPSRWVVDPGTPRFPVAAAGIVAGRPSSPATGTHPRKTGTSGW